MFHFLNLIKFSSYYLIIIAAVHFIISTEECNLLRVNLIGNFEIVKKSSAVSLMECSCCGF